MTTGLRRFAGTLALTALLAPTSSAQITTISSRATAIPANTARFPLHVEAHPEGGAVVTSTEFRGPGGVLEVLLRRFDGNGVELWSTVIPAPDVSGFDMDPSGVTVTANGSTVVAFWMQFFDVVTLISVDAAGGVEWQSSFSAAVAPNMIWYMGIGADSTGNVLLASVENAYLPSGSESVTVRSIDGATGAERWAHSAPSLGNPNGTSVAFGADGRSFVVHPDGTSTRALCLDEQGGVVYDTPGVQLRPTIQLHRFTDLGPSGELVCAHWEPAGEIGTHVVKIDAAGNVVWRRVIGTGTQFPHRAGAVTDDGGIALVYRAVTRLDGDGNVLWTTGAPGGVEEFRWAIADRGGAVIAVGERVSTGFDPLPTLTWLDAGGAILGNETYPQVLAQGSGAVARDARGDVWAHLVENGAPTDDLVAQFGLGDGSAVASCVPTVPNSSGALSRLRATGTDTASDNSLTLVADQLLAGQFTLFLNSRDTDLVVGAGGSAGTLCLGGTIGRFVAPGQLRQADASGLASLELDLTEIPSGAVLVAAAAGETWYFQAWHRDVVAGQPGSNFTGAIGVTLE